MANFHHHKQTIKLNSKSKFVTKPIVYFVQLILIMLTHAKTYFGHHSNLSIIAPINIRCVFICDIAVVKHDAPHGAQGISANGGAFDIQLKPVIGKLTALIDR